MDETGGRPGLTDRLKRLDSEWLREFERQPDRGERWANAGRHAAVPLAARTLGDEIVRATYTTEIIYGKAEAGRLVDALYEKQRYDEASIEFREPTDRERGIYHVGPEHRLLYRGGACTGWSYSRDADGRFTATMRGLDFRYDDERHAQRVSVLVQDAISRARDDGRDSIPYRDNAMESSGRRFVATDAIDAAFVAVGTRTRSSGDRVYESVSLEPGTELFVFGDAIFAPLGDPPRAHEIRFERPSDEAEPFVYSRSLPERVPFPADRAVEVPLTYDRAHWIQNIDRAPLRDYARDHARVVGRDEERGGLGRTHGAEHEL